MRKNYITWIIVLMLSGSAFSQTTVAVGDFQNETERVYLDSWEKKIPEFLHNSLSRSSEILIVERHNLKSIMDEQALNMTGLVDSTTAQKVGQLVSAQYVITGTINEVDEGLRIDARIINVESGRVISEKVQSHRARPLDQMVDMLGNNLRYQLTGQGEYTERIRLSRYPTKPFLYTTFACALSSALLNNLYQDARKEYQDATALDDFDPTYKSANNLYRARNVMLGVTGAAAITTLICWISDMTPAEILASNPPVMPYFASQKKGELEIGLSFAF